MCFTHLLRGSNLFLPREAARGSNFTSAGFGAGMSKEDDSRSFSIEASTAVASQRRELTHLLHNDGRASNRHVRVSRMDNSGEFMMPGQALRNLKPVVSCLEILQFHCRIRIFPLVADLASQVHTFTRAAHARLTSRRFSAPRG